MDDLTGATLYGEGLDDAALEAWFASEEDGYFQLTGGARENPTTAVHRYHALRHLPPRRYRTALALGAADGGEYAAFAGQVDRFIAIEPGRGFWCDTIVMWGIILPLGYLCAFVWHVSPIVLYGVLCLDEFVKLPAATLRYRRYRWLNNITREFA